MGIGNTRRSSTVLSFLSNRLVSSSLQSGPWLDLREYEGDIVFILDYESPGSSQYTFTFSESDDGSGSNSSNFKVRTTNRGGEDTELIIFKVDELKRYARVTARSSGGAGAVSITALARKKYT